MVQVTNTEYKYQASVFIILTIFIVIKAQNYQNTGLSISIENVEKE